MVLQGHSLGCPHSAGEDSEGLLSLSYYLTLGPVLQLLVVIILFVSL